MKILIIRTENGKKTPFFFVTYIKRKRYEINL